jgi:hypothetical protein
MLLLLTCLGEYGCRKHEAVCAHMRSLIYLFYSQDEEKTNADWCKMKLYITCLVKT